MTLNTLSMISNVLRIPDQLRENVAFYQNIRQGGGNTLSEYSSLFNGIVITALDALSGYLDRTTLNNSNRNILLNIVEASYRAIDLGLGLYILRSKPLSDDMSQRLILNFVNIQRLFWNVLGKIAPQYSELFYASLACSLTDTALRSYFLAKRMSKKIKIRQIPDYVGRGIFHIFCIIKPFLVATYIVHGFNRSNVKLIMMTSTATFFLALGIKKIVEKFLSFHPRSLNLQQRNFREWAIAIPPAFILASSMAVKLGLSSSQSSLVGNVLKYSLSTTLLVTWESMLIYSVQRIFTDLRIPTTLPTKIVKGALMIQAVVLNSFILKGFGLSHAELLINIFKIWPITLIPFFLDSSLEKITSLVTSGPMSWKDIKVQLSKVV